MYTESIVMILVGCSSNLDKDEASSANSRSQSVAVPGQHQSTPRIDFTFPKPGRLPCLLHEVYIAKTRLASSLQSPNLSKREWQLSSHLLHHKVESYSLVCALGLEFLDKPLSFSSISFSTSQISVMPEQGAQPASAALDAKINVADGRNYWQNVEADVNGMLGGFPYVSRIDLQGSRNFLAKLGVGTKPGLRSVKSALEGGAGIGRITEGLLLDMAEEVDVVEPIAKFTEDLGKKPGVRQVFNVGLEEWQPKEGDTYDLIWIQWCLGHLTDAQLVQFLERCKAVLASQDGFIVVKENITSGIEEIFDEQDSAVTRTDAKFRDIFKRAGLQLLKQEVQKGFPKELFPVKAYALRPQD